MAIPAKEAIHIRRETDDLLGHIVARTIQGIKAVGLLLRRNRLSRSERTRGEKKSKRQQQTRRKAERADEFTLEYRHSGCFYTRSQPVQIIAVCHGFDHCVHSTSCASSMWLYGRQPKRHALSPEGSRPGSSHWGSLRYGSFLARRNPKMLKRSADLLLLRMAARTFCGSLFHEPPRSACLAPSPCQARPSAGAPS